MEHYAGLDVSLELTSVCIVDERGGIIREEKVASEPEASWEVSWKWIDQLMGRGVS